MNHFSCTKSQIFLTLYILITVSVLSSQQQVQFHDVSDGLSQRIVTSITQDNDGFLWIGTRYGLNKFDGTNYQHFFKDTDQSNSILSNNIQDLCFDSHNTMWIGTYGGGISNLNLNTGVFQNYTTESARISSNYIKQLHLDEHENLWISFENGLINIFDTKKGELINELGQINVKDLKFTQTASIAQIDNYLIIGSNLNEIKLIDTKTYTSQNLNFQENNIRLISKLDNQTFSIGTNSGIYYLDIINKKLEKQLYKNKILESGTILSYFTNEDKKTYIGTVNQGLFICDESNECKRYIENDLSNYKSITGNSVWNIYEDKNGIIWIGLYMKGLNKIDSLENKFFQLKLDDKKSKQKRIGLVNDMAIGAKNCIWIATNESGIHKYDPIKSEFIELPEILNSNFLSTISSIRVLDNKLFLGTWGEGIFIYDEITNELKHLFDQKTNSYVTSGPFIHGFATDNNENIWVASFSNGLDILNKDGDLINSFKYPTIKSNKILTIEKDCDGSMLIGFTSQGVQRIRYQSDIKQFIVEDYIINSDEIAQNKSVQDIYVDSQCKVWIGSQDGLFVNDNNNDKIYKFTTEKGLTSNLISAIIEDEESNIWISTSNGISQFNTSNNHISNYSAKDGLLSNEFSQECILSDQNGILYFGNSKGINFIHPKDVNFNNKIPKIVISQFLTEDSTYYLSKIDNENIYSASKKISLNYYENFIEIKFNSSNLSQSEQNKFEYKLLGLDKKWQLTKEKQVQYKNLRPGSYTFLLKGSNNDGIWNEKPIQFHFKIQKPWYKTYVAWLVYLIILLCILYALLQNFLRRQRLENRVEIERLEKEKLKEIDAFKNQFYTNISHEFMTPLTMIISPLQSSIDDNKIIDKRSKQTILNNAHRLKDYFKDILNISKLESETYQLQIEKQSIDILIKKVISNFIDFAKTKNISIQYQSKNDNDDLFFDKSLIERVIVNLISNAIKYSSSGSEVLLEITEFKDKVTLSIKDNGIGISEEELPLIFNRFYRSKDESNQKGSGLGLSITKQIIDLHQGSIHAFSKAGQGSCFEVNLLRGHAHFNKISYQNLNSKQKLESSLPTCVQSNNIENKTEFPLEQINTELPVILIVEDNDDIRYFLFNHLKKSYQIEVAKDGMEGYQKAISTIPDIIITDVMMPKMDGYELCKALKSNPLTNHIGIIMLTGKSSEESIKTGLNKGADHYITKPFNPSLLNLKIKNLFEFRNQVIKYNNKDNFNNYPSIETKNDTVEVETKPIEPEIALNKLDQEFIQKVNQFIETKMGDESLSVEFLSNHMLVSKSQLFRKMKAIVGISTNQYIRQKRLERAALLIKENNYSIAEITFEVGFSDLQYFRTCFKSYYGVTPSKYSK